MCTASGSWWETSWSAHTQTVCPLCSPRWLGYCLLKWKTASSKKHKHCDWRSNLPKQPLIIPTHEWTITNLHCAAISVIQTQFVSHCWFYVNFRWRKLMHVTGNKPGLGWKLSPPPKKVIFPHTREITHNNWKDSLVTVIPTKRDNPHKNVLSKFCLYKGDKSTKGILLTETCSVKFWHKGNNSHMTTNIF